MDVLRSKDKKLYDEISACSENLHNKGVCLTWIFFREPNIKFTKAV